MTLTPRASARLGITLALVEQRPMPRARRLPGDVIAQPGRTVVLAASVPGLVHAPGGLPRPGTIVERGQTIARLVPLAAVDRDLRAQAQSRVTSADARLVASTSRAERAERLITSGAGSQRAAEEARAERDIARAELVAAQARLRMIDRAPLASDVTTVLRAPFRALVRQVQVADGQAVASGAPLVELVADDPPWVRVAVPVADLAGLRDRPASVAALGDTASATPLTPVAGPPSADPIAGTLDLFFELPAPGALPLGERVAVTWQTEDAPARVVPRSAIVHDTGGGAWVYVQVGPERYDRRRVDLSGGTGEYAALARGPEVGAQVVVAGAAELFGAEFGAGH